MRENTYLVIESWMRTRLNLSGNELIVYAIIYGFSQDGESRFAGSRQYLADWCGCTTRSVQTILNNLTDRDLLTKYEQVVNGVKQCQYVANFTTRENFSPAHENISPNTINNNININNTNIDNNKYTNSISHNSINTIIPNIGFADNIKNNNKINGTEDSIETDVESHGYSNEELKREFLGSAKRNAKLHSKKKSLYSQCVEEISRYTKNINLQTALEEYLTVRFAVKDKPLYGVNQWRSMLNRLSEVSGESVLDSSVEERMAIVTNSTVHGWLSFYASKNTPTKPAGELGQVTCNKNADEEISDEKF